MDDQLLLEFFENQNIEPNFTEKDEKEKPEDYWERTITALDSKSYQTIELAFQEVYGMAYEGGILSPLVLLTGMMWSLLSLQ